MDQETEKEIEQLNHTVDEFAIEMKARLREQAIKGYRGWDDPAKLSSDHGDDDETCVRTSWSGSRRG